VNKLHFGDNLDMLARVGDDIVDLIYLDPPFNSQANYNLVFKSPSGHEVRAQRDAFEDFWQWDRSAQLALQRILATGLPIGRLLESLRQSVGDNSDVMAYLVMMSVRLLELRRVLKPTGSLFLHCDPTASHYLKIIMDSIFGNQNFKNEIIWHYRKWTTGKWTFQRNHDVILFYSKSGSKERVFNQLYMERAASTLKRFGNKRIISGHQGGRRVPSQMSEDDSDGVRMDDVWHIGRVPPIKQIFPTQKPEDLLERIILATTNEGDLVLDPFCGCGTAIVTAHGLKRQWIGIDIAYEAVMIIEARLKGIYSGIKRKQDYIVEGEPKDDTAAKALARDDPYAFQAWALSLLRGQPHGRKEEIKRGGDRGIDGLIYFATGKKKTGFAIVSVTGTAKVNPEMIRELSGTVSHEKAQLGIFVSLVQASAEMRAAAAALPDVDLGGQLHPRIQMFTVQQLMDGARVQLPPVFDLSTLLNLPKALPIMRKVKPEQLRSQINMLLPIRGGVDKARPELPLDMIEEVPRQQRRSKTRSPRGG
jgi:DNA modification methylase